jgi:hypothetical protein
VANANLAQHAEQNEEVASLLAGALGHKTVADRLTNAGVTTSETSVRRYRRNINWDPQDSGVLDTTSLAAQAEEDLIEENERLKEANRRLFKQYTNAKKKRDEYLTTLRNSVRDAFDATEWSPPVPPPTRDSRKNKKEEAAIWHLTDWQGGKKTSSYDMDVMRKRVGVYTEKAAELTEIMRADHPIKHCTILLGGDMIEGVSIFPGQVWELDGTLYEQVFEVADLIAWSVKQALQTYETVEVVGEWGNHGRLGKKGDGIKASDNMDRITYEIAARSLRNEERLVDFKIWDKWYQHFTIGNYKALLVHGDEIKSFGGNTPSYGILRKANSWASGVVPAFRDVYIGHYHQQMMLQLANGGAVYMTGSTESDNEYAREFVAAVSAPSQRLNFVDPEKGRVSFETNIWVSDD